jgi:hypothetical protein
MDIFSELEDIGRMMARASMLATVRQEVMKLKREGMVVTDGSHQKGCDDYDVVVRCGSDGDMVQRRLQESIPDADISRIADGIVGLRQSRREDGK